MFFKMNKIELTKKIDSLGKWIVGNNGLGMRYIIDDLLNENYVSKISSDEIEKFNSNLEILKKTNFQNIDEFLSKKIPDGIENLSLVKEGGNWSYVNKLNTNHSDLTELLVYLIELMVNDSSENVRLYGNDIYNRIIDNPREGLLKFKPKIKSSIEYYFIKNGNGLLDFTRFTRNIKNNSRRGEISENRVRNYLSNRDFNIEYKGGNGNFIDMLFGCDLIVYREDYGYKTVQVKSYLPKKEEVSYYKVDWLAVCDDTNRVQIMDLKTFENISIN